MAGVRKLRFGGFTLIELLVVIAIIAILASILFPVFVSAKKSAQKSNCASNLKQLATAFNMYRGDWNGWYPLGGFKWADSDYSLEWQNVVWKYVKKDAIFRCSATTCPDIDWKNPSSYGSDLTRPRTPVTYLYNMGLGADLRDAAAYKVEPRSHHESEVAAPSRCITLIEGNPGRDDSQAKGIDCHGQPNTLWLHDFTFYKFCNRITGGEKNKAFGLPHHDGGNVLFVDGHVETRRYDSQATLQATLPWLIHVPLRSRYMVGRPIDSEPWQKGW